MDQEKAEEYQVNLPVFEGPLDLLLHLVTKDRIDIHDIPIHLITDQYLAYLAAAHRFNLELGSSFFAMASTLLLIKSRMLLPARRQEESDESDDPRQELARSLEEFRQMKEIRARIEALMEEERPYRARKPAVFKSGAFRGKISIMRLQAAFLSLYESVHEEETLLSAEEVSLDEEIMNWERSIAAFGFLNFVEYLKQCKTRLRLSVSFFALLELIRQGKVRILDKAEGLIVEGVGS